MPRVGKRRGVPSTSAKRIKREEEGVVWGEDVSGKHGRKENFLYTPVTGGGINNVRQSRLEPITGV